MLKWRAERVMVSLLFMPALFALFVSTQRITHTEFVVSHMFLTLRPSYPPDLEPHPCIYCYFHPHFTHPSDLLLEMRLARFERLMARRPFLLSSVLLRQNPHNVEEWHKRVTLYKDNPAMVRRVLDCARPQQAGPPFTQ